MSYYPQHQIFKPSQESLLQWLNTRKNDTDTSYKPGFFSTNDYSKDQTWTIIAILIEITALVLTMYGSWGRYQSNGKIGALITAGVIVFLFIAFDVIGVLLHSNDKKNKVINKNKLILVKSPVPRQQLIAQIESKTPREIIGVFLFIISALLKIFAIVVFFASGKGAIQLVLILTLFYLVVVYIHTFHTGFWLSEIKRRKMFKKDYKQWTTDTRNNVPSNFEVTSASVTQFTSMVPMERDFFQNGRQSIRFINKNEQRNGAVEFNYELESKGILWDDDIVSLQTFFNHQFRTPLLEACTEMQLNQIGLVVANNNIE
jgi:hypothetical protein